MSGAAVSFTYYGCASGAFFPKQGPTIWPQLLSYRNFLVSRTTQEDHMHIPCTELCHVGNQQHNLRAGTGTKMQHNNQQKHQNN